MPTCLRGEARFGLGRWRQCLSYLRLIAGRFVYVWWRYKAAQFSTDPEIPRIEGGTDAGGRTMFNQLLAGYLHRDLISRNFRKLGLQRCRNENQRSKQTMRVHWTELDLTIRSGVASSRCAGAKRSRVALDPDEELRLHLRPIFIVSSQGFLVIRAGLRRGKAGRMLSDLRHYERQRETL